MAAVLLVLAAALARLGGLEARASNEGSRTFHNHGEGPYCEIGVLVCWCKDHNRQAALRFVYANLYDLCVIIPISHLLTVG